MKGDCQFCNKKGVDVHHLTPQQFADKNGFIKYFNKNHVANLANVCKKCHDYFTDVQKSRFAMRQKQILSAKKNGKKYIFQKEFR